MRARAVQSLLAWSLLLVALTGIGVEHYWLRGLKFDDAWIHFRYAVHLAAGDGFVFNAGERVLGSGGVLWNLLLGAMAWATGPEGLSFAVTVLNFLALAATAGVLVVILREVVEPWLAVVLATAMIVQGPLLVASIGGMETTLLCLLYVLVTLALLRERFWLAAALAGCAACLRIESLALAGAVMLGALLYRPRALLGVAAAALLPPAASWLWAWAYFGSPIATSTTAKSIVYVAPPLYALYYCLGALLDVMPLHVLAPLPAHPLAGHWLGIAAWTYLGWRGFLLLRSRSKPASLVAIQALAPIAFYARANPHMFVWYECTFVPLATLFALLGMVDLARRTPGLRTLPNATAAALILLLWLIPLRSFWIPFVPPTDARFRADMPNAREHARTYQYERIAQWLNARTQPEDRVCIPEIGSFGFHYHGPILDGLGLVSPEVLRFHPLPVSQRRSGLTGAIPPDAVRAFLPEYVVSLDVFAAALFADPWFDAHYQLIGRWPWFAGPAPWQGLDADVLGGTEMRAYRRRDRPEP